jgi:hypothetical protein
LNFLLPAVHSWPVEEETSANILVGSTCLLFFYALFTFPNLISLSSEDYLVLPSNGTERNVLDAFALSFHLLLNI